MQLSAMTLKYTTASTLIESSKQPPTIFHAKGNKEEKAIFEKGGEC
jgi:hypothetical protein